ncbi:MAG: hypothetical protein JNL98_05190 [Bryobacterales bacterium]|nr:hypothetical protein [Bryobacterales bacterium]
MSVEEGFDLDRVMVRVWRFLWILAAAGAIVVSGWLGMGAGSSFLFGAVISAISLHLTHRLVMSIGKPAGSQPATGKSVLLGMRWLLIAGFFYVMMKFLGLHISAALCGMLVAAGAAILEILYELILGK